MWNDWNHSTSIHLGLVRKLSIFKLCTCASVYHSEVLLYHIYQPILSFQTSLLVHPITLLACPSAHQPTGDNPQIWGQTSTIMAKKKQQKNSCRLICVFDSQSQLLHSHCRLFILQLCIVLKYIGDTYNGWSTDPIANWWWHRKQNCFFCLGLTQLHWQYFFQLFWSQIALFTV